jgi:hypothetical protein
MNMRMKLSLVTLLSVLLLGACMQEAERSEPVKTTASTSASDKTAPPAKEVEKRDRALARFIHALPGQRNLDVWADNAKAFTDVAYQAITPYHEFTGEAHTFLVRPVGQETATPLLQNRDGLSDGRHYTVIALPGVGSTTPALRIVNDNLTPPAAGKAKVRVIHASPDAGKVDVFLQGYKQPYFAGANFQSVSDYVEIEPKHVVLEVRPQDQNKPMLTTPPVKFEAGKLYTLIITGWAKQVPSLEVVTVEDQLGG